MEYIKNKILQFYDQLKNDKNHRYKSWEHCFSYFSGNDVDKKIACLHMSFYLASWGMYRGSSFLLWKDYLIHQEVVDKILAKKHLQNIDFLQTDESKIDEIFDLIKWVKIWYETNIQSVNGEDRDINVTDTLATKILLGTLGCIPAYDRYFIDGLRTKGLSFSKLTKNNFMPVVKYYKENRSQFDDAQNKILESSRIRYPSMKLVDMYFWQIGFEADNKLFSNKTLPMINKSQEGRAQK